MSGSRAPFDVSLPFVVSATELVCAAKRFKRGDAFPWRDMGLTEHDLVTLWIACQVDAVPNAVEFRVTPGARVSVAPPKQPPRTGARR